MTLYSTWPSTAVINLPCIHSKWLRFYSPPALRLPCNCYKETPRKLLRYSNSYTTLCESLTPHRANLEQYSFIPWMDLFEIHFPQIFKRVTGYQAPIPTALTRLLRQLAVLFISWFILPSHPVLFSKIYSKNKLLFSF